MDNSIEVKFNSCWARSRVVFTVPDQGRWSPSVFHLPGPCLYPGIGYMHALHAYTSWYIHPTFPKVSITLLKTSKQYETIKHLPICSKKWRNGSFLRRWKTPFLSLHQNAVTSGHQPWLSRRNSLSKASHCVCAFPCTPGHYKPCLVLSEYWITEMVKERYFKYF